MNCENKYYLNEDKIRKDLNIFIDANILDIKFGRFDVDVFISVEHFYLTLEALNSLKSFLNCEDIHIRISMDYDEVVPTIILKIDTYILQCHYGVIKNRRKNE